MSKKLFKINYDVIKVMAHGKVEERTVCPITGNKKEPSQWISKEAHRKFGYKAVLAVKRAVEREKNRLPEEVFQHIKEVARELFEKGDKGDKRSDRDIAVFLIGTILSEDMPLKGVENAVRAARREYKKKRKQEERKKKIWEEALKAVESDPTRNFEMYPLIVEGFRVPNSMIVRARKELKKNKRIIK